MGSYEWREVARSIRTRRIRMSAACPFVVVMIVHSRIRLVRIERATSRHSQDPMQGCNETLDSVFRLSCGFFSLVCKHSRKAARRNPSPESAPGTVARDGRWAGLRLGRRHVASHVSSVSMHRQLRASPTPSARFDSSTALSPARREHRTNEITYFGHGSHQVTAQARVKN